MAGVLAGSPIKTALVHGFHAGFERCGYRNRYQPWQRAAIRNERVEPLHFFPLSGARRLSRLVPAPLSSERAKQKRRKEEGEEGKKEGKKRNEKKRKEGKRQRSGRKGKTRSGSEERTNREERLVWKVERRRERERGDKEGRRGKGRLKTSIVTAANNKL